VTLPAGVGPVDGVRPIGAVVAGSGVWVDGAPVTGHGGHAHFG